MQDATRTPPDAIALSLSDAAVRLGISPDAARKRLERGTLRGEKHHGRWTVYLDQDAMSDTVDAASDRTPDATPDTTGRHRTPPDAANYEQNSVRNSQSALAAPNVAQQDDQSSIAPLVDLVADLTRQNADLAVAAALWQERARFLGERLAAIESGPLASGGETAETPFAPVDAQKGPGRVASPRVDDSTLRGVYSEPVPAQVTLATGWRRWFRRVMGG